MLMRLNNNPKCFTFCSFPMDGSRQRLHAAYGSNFQFYVSLPNAKLSIKQSDWLPHQSWNLLQVVSRTRGDIPWIRAGWQSFSTAIAIATAPGIVVPFDIVFAGATLYVYCSFWMYRAAAGDGSFFSLRTGTYQSYIPSSWRPRQPVHLNGMSALSNALN